jgi:hypothetical protein
MPREWYLLRDGKSLGSFTPDDIKSFRELNPGMGGRLVAEILLKDGTKIGMTRFPMRHGSQFEEIEAPPAPDADNDGAPSDLPPTPETPNLAEPKRLAKDALTNPLPSVDRLAIIMLALQHVVELLPVCAQDFASPQAQIESWRQLFAALERLNDALGSVPGGDGEIREPVGWADPVRIVLPELGSRLEALIGNRTGRWGLRDWEDPTRLKWPDFGDIRYRPFQMDTSLVPTITALRACLPTLRWAVERTLSAEMADDTPRDPLPDEGRPLTLGGLDRLLYDCERMDRNAGDGGVWGQAADTPEKMRTVESYNRRRCRIALEPGIKDLQEYCNMELEVYLDRGAIERIQFTLTKKLRKPLEEVRRLPIVELVPLLTATARPAAPDEAPAPPGDDLAAPDRVVQERSIQSPSPLRVPNTPPAPLAIDFKAVVSRLRKMGKGKRATLVEYMADKEEAAVEDVAVAVHDHKETSEKTIRQNADRTNDDLVEMGIPLSFRVVAARVFRDIPPK